MTPPNALSPIDMAIAILQRTSDGNDLAPKHLKLVQLAVNNNLSEEGLSALEELHREVVNSEYSASRFPLFGIQHLTRDNQGYVYWRGRGVEHYSHQDEESMRQAARVLASRCESLEQRGFEVNSRTAICPLHAQAPGDTPWKEAMGRFYSLFEGDGRRVAIFYRYTPPSVVILERNATTGQVETTLVDSAYDAFHLVQDQGLKSNGPRNDYQDFCRFMEESGLTPEVIHVALN